MVINRGIWLKAFKLLKFELRSSKSESRKFTNFYTNQYGKRNSNVPMQGSFSGVIPWFSCIFFRFADFILFCSVHFVLDCFLSFYCGADIIMFWKSGNQSLHAAPQNLTWYCLFCKRLHVHSDTDVKMESHSLNTKKWKLSALKRKIVAPMAVSQSTSWKVNPYLLQWFFYLCVKRIDTQQ